MQRLIALTDNNSLLSINPKNLSQITTTPVTGIEGTLIGIDTRPANGLLYGLTTANKIYTLDPNGFSSGDFGGLFTLDYPEVDLLLNDALYINLHTAPFTGGELRGQIDVTLENDIVAFGLPIEAAQEVGTMVPPADIPAMGNFNVIYDDSTNTLRITGSFTMLTGDLLPVGPADGEGNPQSSIHLHRGAAGENGPILRNLTVNDDGTFMGTFTLTEAEESLLLDQALYLNIHTDSFGAGELRGQLAVEVENDVVVLGVPIEEAQEVGAPVPIGPAMGSFDVIFDNSTRSLAIDGSFSDLAGPLFPVGPADAEGNRQSAVHLHQGVAGTNGPILRNLSATDNVATLVSTLSVPFGGGAVSGFDFNPVPDRLRLVGDNDQNFRINVDTGEVIVDGTLAFVEGDRNAGVNPNITAAAYTNSLAGATSTQLFNIDALLNTLVLQNPPNAGGLVTVGNLGIDFGVVGGFDIVSTPEGKNMGLAVSKGELFSIDLETGAATSLGSLALDADVNLIGLAAIEVPPIPPNFLALTSNNTLLGFSAADPSQVTSFTVTGIQGTLIGIDVRPADGKLYGLTTANKIYTIDPTGFNSGDFSGLFTLGAPEVDLLLNDALYINLHTAPFTGGELRGQIDVTLENDIVAFGLPIEAAQEVGTMVPPADIPAMGSFNVIYDDSTNTLRITGSFTMLTGDLLPVGPADGEGNPQSSIHLHRGAAGENGPILRNLTVNDDGTFMGTFTLTEAEEALLLDQALYLNIHTDSFGAGELRGQLAVEVAGDVVVLGVPIEEAQEVGAPVPIGPAMGSFDVIFDSATNRLAIDGSFSDLAGPLFPVGPADAEGNRQSAVHLHQGVAGTNGPILRNLSATDNVATLVSTLSVPFGGGVVSGFDFNPVPDRLRLVGDNDQNFRINVDTGEVIVDGTLAFVEGDRNAGMNPNITAAAYTNSFAGATSTQLFNIDALLNTLVLQNPPNAGGLVTVGDLGVNFGVVGGFDILSTPEGDNAAFAASNSTLFSIDLKTGAATNLGTIGDGSRVDLLGFVALSAPLVGGLMPAPDLGGGHDHSHGHHSHGHHSHGHHSHGSDGMMDTVVEEVMMDIVVVEDVITPGRVNRGAIIANQAMSMAAGRPRGRAMQNDLGSMLNGTTPPMGLGRMAPAGMGLPNMERFDPLVARNEMNGTVNGLSETLEVVTI